MDFIDKQNVERFQVGQNGGEVAGLGDDRAGGRTKTDPQFARHDLRERGLAETRRAEKQHMIHRLAPATRRFDEHPQVVAQCRLTDEIIQQLRADMAFRLIVLGKIGGDGAILTHAVSSFSPARIRSSTAASSPMERIAPDTAPNAAPR